MKTDFLIDLFSTVPFDIVVVWFYKWQWDAKPHPLVKTIASLIKLLKMMRIKRIGTAIRNMNQKVELKTNLKIANTILGLLIYIHVVACLLYMVFDINKEWWPATEFMFYGLRDDKDY